MTYQIGLSNGNKLIPKRYWKIPNDKELKHAMTLKQAAKKYHYSRNTILRKIKKNELTGFKIGRRWYVLPHGLIEKSK
jgi:excisionase family DNA binding protein